MTYEELKDKRLNEAIKSKEFKQMLYSVAVGDDTFGMYKYVEEFKKVKSKK